MGFEYERKRKVEELVIRQRFAERQWQRLLERNRELERNQHRRPDR